MSSQGCETFVNALREEGAPVYFFGTFLLHYAPFVITFIAYTDKWTRTSVVTHILMATSLFCIYSLFKNPVITYGCSSLDETIPIVATTGFSSLLILLYLLIDNSSLQKYVLNRKQDNNWNKQHGHCKDWWCYFSQKRTRVVSYIGRHQCSCQPRCSQI